LLVRSLSPLYISLKSTDNSSLIQFLPTRRSSDLPAASATRSSTPRPYNRAATTPAATAADSGLLLRAGPGRARQADASPGPAAGVEPAVHGQQDPQPSSSPPRPHLILSRRHEYFDAAGRARVPPRSAMPSHCPHPPPGRGRPADRR